MVETIFYIPKSTIIPTNNINLILILKQYNNKNEEIHSWLAIKLAEGWTVVSSPSHKHNPTRYEWKSKWDGWPRKIGKKPILKMAFLFLFLFLPKNKKRWGFRCKTHFWDMDLSLKFVFYSLGLDNSLISAIPIFMDKLIDVIIVHRMNLFALIGEGGNWRRFGLFGYEGGAGGARWWYFGLSLVFVI